MCVCGLKQFISNKVLLFRKKLFCGVALSIFIIELNSTIVAVAANWRLGNLFVDG
jgi:hypothetical protein